MVSVLFCDMVDFTAASKSTRPRGCGYSCSSGTSQMARREIERFGGTVEKFIGDAVMAVFGAPLAREDDPERAVRAGLAIIERAAELRGGPEQSLTCELGSPLARCWRA